MQRSSALESYLNKIGNPGSKRRLKAIASLNLGERSQAAKAALRKRHVRKELMSKGYSFSEACLMVNSLTD